MAMMFRNAMRQPAVDPMKALLAPDSLTPQPMAPQSLMPQTPPFQAPDDVTGKPNWAGIAADFLSGVAGQQPVFAPIQARDKARSQALQDAETQRQRDVADWISKEQWKRENPAPSNNDTISDFNWYKGLSDDDKAIYHRMKPEYRQGADGRFYRLDIAPETASTGPLPSFSQDDWDKAGGSAGNGTGGFR